jgi:hypothetical protein
LTVGTTYFFAAMKACQQTCESGRNLRVLAAIADAPFFPGGGGGGGGPAPGGGGGGPAPGGGGGPAPGGGGGGPAPGGGGGGGPAPGGGEPAPGGGGGGGGLAPSGGSFPDREKEGGESERDVRGRGSRSIPCSSFFKVTSFKADCST